MKMRKGLMIAMACMSLPAAAQDVLRVEEIGDTELAQLRGRFVLPDRVVHFGVTMTTLWQNGAGQIGAQVQFQMNAGSQPSLHVSPIDEAGVTTAVSQGNGVVMGGAGLGNVQGVVQSVRSAGDYNEGLNDLSINVRSAVPGAVSGQAWNGPMAWSNDVGNVQIIRQAGGLQIAVQAKQGQGNARHFIGAGQLAQQSNIGGSLNRVINAAELDVVMKQVALGTQLAQCAWDQLRSGRPIGY